MIKFIDKKNRFVELFNPETGFYVRSGVYDTNGNDTLLHLLEAPIPQATLLRQRNVPSTCHYQ